jgi:ribosome-binding protein aMBF1 (putative translation factor)
MMAIDKTLFGPQSEEEKETFALEALVVSVQIALHRAMTKHGVSSKELAERLGMSPANMTLRTIAKIQAALDEEFELVLKCDLGKKKSSKEESAKVIAHFLHQKPASLWQEVCAQNNNRKIEPAAA